MPQVPVYGTRQVSTRPLPGARVDTTPPPSIGRELGDMAARIGTSKYAEIQDRERQRADEVAFMAADRQAAELENRLVYDPQKGALTVKGKDAVGLPDSVLSEYDTRMSEIETGLASDRQRLAFQRVRTNRRAGLQATLLRHAAAEGTAYEQREAEAYVTTARETAIANAYDVDRVQLERDRARAVIAQTGRRNGLAPEVIAELTSRSDTAIHAGVIDSMLTTGKDRAAAAYFAQHRDEIAGSVQTAIQAKLDVASTETLGLQTADEIWTAVGPKTDLDPINLDVLEQQARQKFADDPKALKTTLQYIRERASAFNAATRERSEANEAAVWQAVTTGKTLSDVRTMPEYLALSGKAQNAIREHIVDRAQSEADRVQRLREHNADRAYTLSQRAKAQEQEDPRKMAAYWDYQRPEVLSKMTDAQVWNLVPTVGIDNVNRLMATKRTYEADATKVRDATMDRDLFKDIASAAGFNVYATGDKVTKAQRADNGRLLAAVEAAIDAEQRATGKPLDRARKQAIMESVIDRTVMIDDWGSDTERIAGVVNKDEAEKAYVPQAQIPSKNLDEAVNVIRATVPSAQRLTRQQILAQYQERIERAYAAHLLGLDGEAILGRLQGK